MEKKKRIIILSILSILIVALLVIGITYAFMKQNIDTSSVTEVSLTSCAKITLTDTGSIDLSNTYPMTKNRALQTTPYTFTVTSSCETYVGFNLYLATLSTNTIAASNIHYIITSVGSKEIITEGILSSATNATSSFTNEELTQYNTGLNGTVDTIYQLYNDKISLKGTSSYDLYLYVDESVTNDTMGKSFVGGIAVKSYDREADPTLANYITSLYTTDGENGLYLHDADLENGANDGSYRYSGGDYVLTSTATNAGYTTLLVSSSDEIGGLIDFYCNGSKQYVGSSCDTSYAYYYTVAGSGSYTTYQEALDAGVSQGYLTSDNVKNFVCFGTYAKTCPSDNLYRIIGVFDDQVKLIKYDYANTDLLGTDGDYYNTLTYHISGKRDLTTSRYWYYWSYSNSIAANSATGYYNVWSYSALNTVNLNTNYISNIGSEWANKIATTTWKVGEIVGQI